jgi:hypothetical protein
VDGARAQHRGADLRVLRRELLRERLGEAEDAVLREHVGAEAGRRHEARHGGGVDDVPAVLVGLEDREEVVDAVDHAPQVHVDDPLPVVEREVGDVADRADAGVVGDDVRGAEALDDLSGQRGDAVRLRDIALDARRPELRGRRLQGAVLDVGDDDLHALADQGVRDALADPRCAAGDDGDLPFKLRERGHGSSSDRWPGSPAAG